ncbi:hypothetical protein [Legionella gresilensis]|uniref:hypothetical protein n=1 Tax=Legionella gresilensis TaxID=91823 RepID=UPI0013EFB244|nr:hypothetical protein [Legionella gresilensis]
MHQDGLSFSTSSKKTEEIELLPLNFSPVISSNSDGIQDKRDSSLQETAESMKLT